MKYKFETASEISLKDFLKKELCFLSSSNLSRLISKGEVKINGERTRENVPLHKGDVLLIFVPQFMEELPPIKIIFADQNVVVVDKNSGIDSAMVGTQLREDFDEIFDVHRLDRYTAGVMIFARNESSYNELTQAFSQHAIIKQYEAVVVGKPPKSADRVELILRKDSENSVVKVSKTFGENCKTAITDYKVVGERDGLTELEINLLTGRTHQIRVTMQYLGCPILGDDKYGDSEANKRYKVRTQQLIAKRLSFNSLSTLSYLNGKLFESEKKFYLLY